MATPEKKVRKNVCNLIESLREDHGDDLPENLLELWTDLDDYPDLDEEEGVNYVVGYVQGVADTLGIPVKEVLDECGVELEEKDEDDEEEDD